MSRGKILFQLSGSIACFKACALLSSLVKSGFEVEVVATRSALEFVGEATLEGLTGRRVHIETFASGEYMNHIHLARWADLLLLCPATANTLNKLASGIGDDLISALFLAHNFTKPYLVAPAMNASMLRHPATQSSLLRLQDWGVEVLGSGDGPLACGEVGEGRLLEPEHLLSEIEKRFSTTAAPLSILLTSGGTREPIDGVRSIANTSTGSTGAALADYFISRGHRVTYVHATNAMQPRGKVDRAVNFESFSDLEGCLQRELKAQSFDAVIHAAAVSDYRVAEVASPRGLLAPTGKIESSDELSLKLVRTPKLVDRLRSWSRNPLTKIVAFKLTNTEDAQTRAAAIAKLATHAQADFIVHNDLHGISDSRHEAIIFAANETPQRVAQTVTKVDLARALESLLIKKET